MPEALVLFSLSCALATVEVTKHVYDFHWELLGLIVAAGHLSLAVVWLTY